MPKVSVPRDRLADGSLPAVCVVCGGDAPHRLYPNVAAPSLAWVLFSPLLGLLTFWGYILLAGGSARSGVAGLPFCDRHRRYWPRRARVIVLGFVGFVGVIVAAAILSPPPAPNRPDEPHWLAGVVGCWALIYLPVFLVLHLGAMRPTGSTRKSVVLSGVSHEFAAAVADAGGRA